MKIKKCLIFSVALVGVTFTLPAKSQTPKLSSPEFQFSADCKDADSSAVIAFNGDVLIHDDLYKHLARIKAKKFSGLWKDTDPLIQKADFAVANLEGPAALGLSSNGKDYGDVGFIYDAVRMKEGGPAPAAIYSGTNKVFNFHPIILNDLKNSGYDLLTTANNHALDRSWKGIDKTLKAAKEVGIPTVGTRPSDDKSVQFYHYQDIKGVKVAFISCTQDLNGFRDTKDQVLLCYQHSKKIIEMISTLSRHPSVDAVIVLPHWGDEYRDLPNKEQYDYTRMYLDAGAIAVIGGHPHVMQPWEKYVTKDGRETLVLYSMGNFVACQLDIKRKTGVIAYLSLSKRNGQTRISGVGYTSTQREGVDITPTKPTDNVRKNLMIKNFGVLNQISEKQSLSRFCK